jgi:hypothetical protein
VAPLIPSSSFLRFNRLASLNPRETQTFVQVVALNDFDWFVEFVGFVIANNDSPENCRTVWVSNRFGEASKSRDV